MTDLVGRCYEYRMAMTETQFERLMEALKNLDVKISIMVNMLVGVDAHLRAIAEAKQGEKG